MKPVRYDLTGEPVTLAPRKWLRFLHRDPAEIVGVVMHAWATNVGTTPKTRQRWGEAEATARRGLAVPYNISAGVTRLHGVPVVAYCQPLPRYTYASDAACGHWLSVGVMGQFPFEDEDRVASRHTPVTEALCTAVDDALSYAVELLAPHRKPGGPPLRLITHRQAINGKGDHANCPGEAVVAMACASMAVQCGDLVPDPDLALISGWSRPWPAAWRRYLPAESSAPPQVSVEAVVSDC